MTNKMTDELNLVQIASVKGFLGLFSRTIGVADGFSLEIFRGDTHLGSIMSNDIKLASDIKTRCERLGARDGDTILRINLGPRTLTLTGELYTQDGYARHYEIMLELRVSNPAMFAQRYRQQSDPIFLSKAAIEGEFQNYAERKQHDQMDPANLRYQAEHTLEVGSNQEIGVTITRAHKSLLGLDPKRAQELEARQQAQVRQTETRMAGEVKKTEVEVDAEVQDLNDRIERRRVEEFAEFVRVEESKEQLHLRREALFSVAAKEAMTSLSERIHEEIAMGRSLSEVFNDYPELRDIFLAPTTGILASAERPAIAGASSGGTQAPNSNTSDDKDTLTTRQDTETQSATVREQMNSMIHSTHLGVTLIPKVLTTAQRKSINIIDTMAFIVWEIDKDGPAQKADLQIFDALVEINGESIRDAQTMTNILTSSKPGLPVNVRVLRNENLIEIPVDFTQ